MEGDVDVAVALSQFAQTLSVETAFTVLAVAKQLKAAGKDVVELEIGDSPFDSTASAKSAGVVAIEDNQSHYCPSPGIPEFREAAAKFVSDASERTCVANESAFFFPAADVASRRGVPTQTRPCLTFAADRGTGRER